MLKKHHNPTDAALKLILETQLKKNDLEKCWIDGYRYGINSNDTEPKAIPDNLIDETDINYWIQGWYAGFNKEPILFYNQSDYKPSSQKTKIAEKQLNKTKLNNDQIFCLAQ